MTSQHNDIENVNMKLTFEVYMKNRSKAPTNDKSCTQHPHAKKCYQIISDSINSNEGVVVAALVSAVL